MKHKSILLVGVGNFGKHIARKFNELGHDVMAIDQDEERINDVMPLVTSAQIGEARMRTSFALSVWTIMTRVL